MPPRFRRRQHLRLAANPDAATTVDAAVASVKELRKYLAPLTDAIEEQERVLAPWLDELERIGALVDKITTVHGDRHPELADVQRLYGRLRADLEPHLRSEEEQLFPAVRAGAAAGDPGDVASLLEEHETVGALLEELRDVTSGYAVPPDGCASYAATYRALDALDRARREHLTKP